MHDLLSLLLQQGLLLIVSGTCTEGEQTFDKSPAQQYNKYKQIVCGSTHVSNNIRYTENDKMLVLSSKRFRYMSQNVTHLFKLYS